MTAADTTGVRPGFELDEQALLGWMRGNVEDFSGPLAVEQFKGGQSNPTYRLVTPTRNYVLRRKPSGPILKGAHAVEREAKVLQALAGAGFPVPRVFGLCTDDAVIGTWFYVMECVDGRIFWDAAVPEVSRSERTAIYDAMNDTIARLHTIDYAAVGLADYGNPRGFLSRQIKRWSTQYQQDELAGRDPNMDRLIAWLEENLPPDDDEPGIAHGDFRIDNMIFHPTEPRVLAVLDWELSTLGHRGVDFAYHAMAYRIDPAVVAGLKHADLAALGVPSEQDYVAAYCARAGRGSMPHYEYYMAFSFFRLAAIFHGIKGRVLRGTAASAEARDRVKILPDLMAYAWQQTARRS